VRPGRKDFVMSFDFLVNGAQGLWHDMTPKVGVRKEGD